MIDLAVVGGGLAGSYVAYRMSRLRPDWSIGLFESSNRIGGRLLSVATPGVSIPTELGGMRYRVSQPLIQSVVGELDLETRPFPVTHEDNRYYLRQQHLTSSDFKDPSRVPYGLKAPFEGLSPAELIVQAFETIVPGASNLSDHEWPEIRRNHRFDGKSLAEWGLKDLLLKVVGEEGYQMLIDGLGYTSIFGNWNAAEAIPWFLIETRRDSENRTLVEGMEVLPRELARRFTQAGGNVRFGHRLVQIGAPTARGGCYALSFDRGQSVNAARIVLALPLAPLKSVSAESSVLGTPRMTTLLSSVTAHPMTKVFLIYDEAWWRKAGLKGRRSVSDLPLRKTYLLDESDNNDERSLLLASYSDGPSVDYWRLLAPNRPMQDDGYEYGSENRWPLYAAPEDLVKEAHRQVMQMHPVQDVPAPIAGALMDWGASPFEGAWHAWNPGVKTWDVLPLLLEPAPGESIFVCGEALSSWQGWMEGALETGHMVVERLMTPTA